MTTNEWLTLGGVVASVVLTVTPWMFAVHARLAVVASQIEQLCEKLEKVSTAHEERLAMCIAHQSRLESMEVRIADLSERMRELT
jgi:hypothetical protein